MLKIITTGFEYGASDKYSRLMDVFIYSVEKSCPEAQWICNWLKEPETNGITRGFISNTVKLQTWIEELSACSEGDQIIFMDCDMLMIDDPSDAFDNDFDVAYTYRTECKWPVNGGVIFCKVNEKSRKFFNRFLEVNMEMIKNRDFHQHWRNKYAGINQSAFGYMLEEEPNICNLFPLPCSIYNVCDYYDEAMANGAKILHIKGQLRKQLFSFNNPQKELEKAILIWNDYYEEYKKNGNK